MVDKPSILVTLVHIEGPLKGEIQELREEDISIGRLPSCHVLFPKDFRVISREHAHIVREGNRFKVLDQSANGTFVNGERIQEKYLQSGDVLVFSEGGPKVSFLSAVEDGPQVVETVTKKPPGSPPLDETIRGFPVPPVPPQPSPPRQNPGPTPAGGKAQVPLVIQYGVTLRSFKELPVSLGSHPACDFGLDHPGILDRHAMFYFEQGQYWIRDLTGQGLVAMNGRPVGTQAPLQPDSLLSLSPTGPTFRFLGGGRLAEYEEPSPE